MKLYVFAVAISIVSITASSAGICYQHYDKNGQLIYAGRKPPFDISGPPLSLEYQAARDRGERIVITPSNSCSLPDKGNYPVEPVKKQGTVRSMTADEYDEYRRQHPPEPLPKIPPHTPSKPVAIDLPDRLSEELANVCFEALRVNFYDPYSARMDSYKILRMPDGGLAAVVMLNGKNRFGAYVGSTPFYCMKTAAGEFKAGKGEP